MRLVAFWWAVCLALGYAKVDWAAVPICGLIGIMAHQYSRWPQLRFDLRLGRWEWIRCLVWCYVGQCAISGGLIGFGRLLRAIQDVP
jgi:hypothetical protein